jgi:excisionase family DNA binding protein
MSSGVLEIALRVTAEIKAREQMRGINAADVLRVFPGSRVVSLLPCRRCGGKLIERLERRRHVLACGRCGRKKWNGLISLISLISLGWIYLFLWGEGWSSLSYIPPSLSPPWREKLQKREKGGDVTPEEKAAKKAKAWLLDPEQASELLGISRSSVIRLIVDGSLPAICLKSGRRKKVWRIRKEVLQKWVISKERTARTPVTTAPEPVNIKPVNGEAPDC